MNAASRSSALHSIPILAVLCLGGCELAGAAGRRDAPLMPPPAAASPFVTTFWCGPPHEEMNDARAAEIVAAGFTDVGPPCEGATPTPALNRRSLDVAARHGLRLWVVDHRYHPLVLEQADWAAQIAAAVAEYRDHPALAGYFIVDEPPADAFADLAAIVGAVHAHDPARPAYVNLLPDYIYPEHLKARNYAEYVDGFLTTVRPRLLSYDYYPFGRKTDRPTFFTNLAFMRERALRHRLPFWLIVLAMPHGGYREPSEAELAWQVFHALAYGARGISYFAYWTPVRVAHADRMKFRDGLIAGGRPTRRYAHAARLNREVRAIGDALAAYASVAVADARGEVAAPLPAGPLAAVGDVAISVGIFAAPGGRSAALLVNRDYRHATTARLRMQAGFGAPQLFDSATRAWVPLPSDRVTLPPGRAQLLAWAREDLDQR